MEKKYRVVSVGLCSQHNRVSLVLVSTEKQLNPQHFIRQEPKMVAGGMMIFQMMSQQMQHTHSGTVIFDLSPEEYAELGSPHVNQIMTIKIDGETK